ncbi:hypothetical protein ACFL2V_18885 [Pseudomonadota bacterium]
MKKALFTICLIVAALFINEAPMVLAQAQGDPLLFQPASLPGSQLDKVGDLPKGEWQTILAEVIKITLSIVGSLTLIALTYGGIMFVTARGNDEQLTKAKDMITWSMVALLIIGTSYAIVLGVTRLRFFNL